MAKKYFGTDGIRGAVGTAPITPDFMLKLGWAAGKVFEEQGHCQVVIGKDTRRSGYMFEAALEAGLVAAGADVFMLGPMPTPGIAHLTCTLRAQVGIVISASHNPHYDNGIKFFSSEGAKLSDDLELAIEEKLDEILTVVDSEKLGKAVRVQDAASRYIEFCKASISSTVSLKGIKLVVDCAQGAAYHVAPIVFEELGAEVIKIGVSPDGLNINDGYGATMPSALQLAVKEHEADLGIALDGDGDRLIMVDAHGEIIDGDEILYILAKARARSGQLNSVVVGTQMTNLGIELALNAADIKLQRSAVGDRHVIKLMQDTGAILGGEGSGHIICGDKTTTGDGIISALQVLEEMKLRDESLAGLIEGVEKCPQCMINVKLLPTQRFELNEVIQSAVEQVELKLNGRGRVLLRPSGTEPLVRVMIEGKDLQLVEALTKQLSETVQENLVC